MAPVPNVAHKAMGAEFEEKRVFVGSRACAANHYAIVEKCGHIYILKCMSTSSASLDLANSFQSGVRYGFRKIVVTHPE